MLLFWTTDPQSSSPVCHAHITPLAPSKGSPRADSRVLSLQHGPFPDPKTGLPSAFPNCISDTLAGTLHLTFILPC